MRGLALPYRALRKAARIALNWASKTQDYTFDLIHGTDTTGNIDQHDLDNAGADGLGGAGYQATRARPFDKVMHSIDPPLDCGFVDFGCGKGKTLLLAARFGFSRIVGVEIARDLVSVAQTNVDQARWITGTEAIEIVRGDARDFSISSADHVFFFFNPFDWPIMAVVVDQLIASVREHPRSAWLIYLNPVHSEELDQCDGLSYHSYHSFAGGGRDVVVFTVTPTELR